MKAVDGGRIEVLTFKEGLLSKVAHDLALSLERFEVFTDGERIEGTFHADSLRVEGAMRSGVVDPGALSDGDKREIGVNLREKVLHTDAHPLAQLEATARRANGRYEVEGKLTLAGKSADVKFEVEEHDGRWRGEVVLEPSRWGIRPFKALLGAIKLKDQVVVRFDLPRVEL